jgi:hypothetical protein
MTGGMRTPLLIALAAVVTFCGSAAASDADVDPGKLVLQEADVPKGFTVDEEETGVQSNREAGSDREARALVARSGRITGYEAEFDRGTASISSRADLFRTAAGATMLLRYLEREIRKAGIARMRAARVRIGAEGWVWGVPRPVSFSIVVWRYRRVFAGIAVAGIPRARALALARVQQRRIAAALR